MKLGTAAIVVVALAAQGACSASGDGRAATGGGQTGGTGGGAGSIGAGGSGATSDASAGSGGIVVDAGSNDGNLNQDTACAADVAEAEPVPVNLYLMLDRSGSMAGSKWTQATAGMSAFVQDPLSAGLRIALNYFPSDANDCDPLSYSTPKVLLGELTAALAPADAQEQLLVDSLSTTKTTGLTPTYPAFVGQLGYCTSVAKKNPKEKVIAVLLTDGSPGGCTSSTNTIANIAALAASGYGDNPPIITFTIGLDGSKEAELKQIAQAGGGEAFFLGGSQNVQQDLINKLQQIAGGELACEYVLPESDSTGKPADPAKVNVNYYPSGGTSQGLFKVASAQACVPNGWYYDDPQNPTRIILCPATCASVQNDAGAKVQILLGCESEIPS
jgi:Mg-chelatase subunit ChlD